MNAAVSLSSAPCVVAPMKTERDSVLPALYESRGTARVAVGVGAGRGTAELSRHSPYENHGVIQVGSSVWSGLPPPFSPQPSCDIFDGIPTAEKSLRTCKFLHQALAVVVLAMSAQSGRFAVEAGGAPPDADSNLAQVQIARVREFREKNLLLADEDFAYAFASFEEAVLAGGDFFGGKWASVRMEQDRLLLPAAAAALEAPASSSFRPTPAKPYVAPVKKPVAQLSPGKEAPEQIVQRVDSLTNAFRAMGVMRPAASPMSQQLLKEWSQSLRRLAQDKVTCSDKATIVNALRTWHEFEEHLALRNRELPPESLDVDTFLNDGTPAPTRALNSLRWLSN